jgi:uncharacterized protein with HEPN domain
MPSESEATRCWLNDDIQRHIAMAQSFIEGMDYEAFKDDNLHIYAVTRCLEIISKASRRLPEALKARHPSIQWREMAAAGDIYRHEYEDVAARRVWRTVSVSLPLLHAVVARELEALAPNCSDESPGQPQPRLHLRALGGIHDCGGVL